MTFEQALQLAGLVVTGLTTWRGYAAVAAKLENYVPVEIYSKKISQLHDEINALRERLARMEGPAK